MRVQRGVPVVIDSVDETHQEKVRSYNPQVLKRKPPLSTSLPPQRDTVIRGALVLGSTHHAKHIIYYIMRGRLLVHLLAPGAVSVSFTLTLPQANE
jgi:hypothetical protein